VSDESIQQAIRNAVARASESLKGLDWFEMTEVRGLVKEGKVSQFDRRRFLLTSLAGAVAAPLAAKAKALGLTIPPSLLLRADQMIDQ
jgi:hypothetical protein